MGPYSREHMTTLRIVDHPQHRPRMAHARQSRPNSGRGFQVKVLEPFQVVPYSLGRTYCRENSEHMRQSRPDSGRGFQARVLKT